MEFEKLIEKRRSVRAYQDAEIPHDDIVSILSRAQQAPSWKNSQTSRCYIAETAAKLDELRTEGLPAFNAKNSVNALLIVTTFVKDIVGFTNKEPDNDGGNFWGAYDLGLHDAYMVLAAADAGYDTLIMGLRDADAIRKIMDIPENEQIMSVIALGKKEKDSPYRPRRDLNEVVRFE